LTANDLETSEIPYSSHFALNQKTLFLNAKVIIFFERQFSSQHISLKYFYIAKVSNANLHLET